MGVPTLVFLLFLYLKLSGEIDWSWWWVCSPLLAEVILSLIGLMVWAIVTANARAELRNVHHSGQYSRRDF